MITDVLPQDLKALRDLADEKPIKPPPPTVSGMAQDVRELPPGTPFPGPWDNAKTPYWVEVMDCFSEFSPVKMVTVMKARKVGATTALPENIIPYWIKIGAPMAYVTSDEELAKDWSTIKLPAVLHSFGLQDKIVAQTFDGRKASRSGSTTYKKEYFGGVLDIFSAASKRARRALDKRLLFIDEVDGVPAMTTSGEGNWVEVLLGHGMSWGARFKALLFSSPTTEEASNIWHYYQKGDQRVYHVPCPHCGTMQPLKFDPLDPNRTMRPIWDDNHKLIDAVYICQHLGCGKPIKNYQKSEILLCEELGGRAKWVPTATPSDPLFRSYHINALYAPPDMLSFTEFYRAYINAVSDENSREDGMRSFKNIFCGIPYREQGRKPKIEDTTALRGAYKLGTVPMGPVYLTMGVDVQTGKDARLECAIWGHGFGYRTWLIDYLVFPGATEIPNDGAWALLNDWAARTQMSFARSDGQRFTVQMVFVDSGDGNVTATVYQFCEGWRNTFPSKGEQRIQNHEKRLIDGDKPGVVSEVGYQRSQRGQQSGQYLYRVGTNYYKRLIYQNLEVQRIGSPLEKLAQRPRFMDFPEDTAQTFFDQLLGEELRADGSYHPVRPGQRVEGLDTTVYAICAGDVWLHALTNAAREKFKQQYPQLPMSTIIERVTPLMTLAKIAEAVGVKPDDHLVIPEEEPTGE